MKSLSTTETEFREWRHRLGLSQAEAAHELGISKSMLKYYERGKYAVPRSVERAMSDVERHDG